MLLLVRSVRYVSVALTQLLNTVPANIDHKQWKDPISPTSVICLTADGGFSKQAQVLFYLIP